jgi:hypothetical protein
MSSANPFTQAYFDTQTDLSYSSYLEQLLLILLAMRKPMQEGTIYDRYRSIGGNLAYQAFAPLRDVIEQIYGL